MSEKEINEAFDREYERYKNSPEYKEGFVKIKMPEYYIAKHSDEDLRAAVLAEREACAQLVEDFEPESFYLGQLKNAAKTIRARSKHD